MADPASASQIPTWLAIIVAAVSGLCTVIGSALAASWTVSGRISKVKDEARADAQRGDDAIEARMERRHAENVERNTRMEGKLDDLNRQIGQLLVTLATGAHRRPGD